MFFMSQLLSLTRSLPSFLTLQIIHSMFSGQDHHDASLTILETLPSFSLWVSARTGLHAAGKLDYQWIFDTDWLSMYQPYT